MDLKVFSQEVDVATSTFTLKAFPQPGTNKYRVICAPDDPKGFRTVFRHFLQQYITLPNFTKAPLCLQTEDCPGCQLAQELAQAGDREGSRRVAAKLRAVMYVIDRQEPYDALGNLTPKLLEISQSLLRDLGRLVSKWNYNFADPEGGCDIILTIPQKRQGRGQTASIDFDTEAREGSMHIKPSPLTPEERALLSDLDLDKAIEAEMPDPEVFRQALFATEPPSQDFGAFNFGPSRKPVGGLQEEPQLELQEAGEESQAKLEAVPETASESSEATAASDETIVEVSPKSWQGKPNEFPFDSCLSFGADFQADSPICLICPRSRECIQEIRAKVMAQQA